MKVATSSSAFSCAFDDGDLTQLEFLEAAAREMGADGVVLDDRHFPRIDDDYLAQVKKTAADLGLTIAALASDAFFSAQPDAMRALLERAATVGAPLVSGRLARETELSWSEALTRLGVASAFAKSINVTLALRNAPGTFAATSHDCKRVTKETDSAWLRYGLDTGAFDAASETAALAAKTVLLWWDAQRPADLRGWETFRGFVALDRAAGDAARPEMRDAILRWKIARHTVELDRT